MGVDEFYPLHVRSQYSFLNSPFSIERICLIARERRVFCAGLTDINGVYGLPEFLSRARSEGLKALGGSAIYADTKHLYTVYVYSRQGMAVLCRLLSALYEDPGFDTFSIFSQYGFPGLAVVCPSTALLLRFISLDSYVPGRVYAGVFYGCPFRQLASWAREHAVPMIALHDTIYENDRDRAVYRLLRAVELRKQFDKIPQFMDFDKSCCLPATDDFLSFYSSIPEALENNRKLAREAALDWLFPDTFIFPRFDNMCDSMAFEKLAALCQQGAVRRYGKLRPDVQTRLTYELSIIKSKGFSSYFLVVHDIVVRSRRTCGRGSSAASIVSYLLGITHVDPLKHNLFFERFLNSERLDPPDIDVDFPWDEREKALSYVFERYEGRAAMVADHVCFRKRSAVRESAAALGFTDIEIASFGTSLSLGDYEKIPPRLRKAAEAIIGFPRYLGTHPGGVVITPGNISRYAPVQRSPLGWPLLAWEKDGTESAGLVKIDLLGNRSLAVIRDCIKLVNRRGGDELDWETFNPIRDKGTTDMISRGDTMGVFYVESPATRQLLRKMRSGKYEHLVIASSIIRPAANKYASEFVERLNGKHWEPLHPLVEDILRDSFGIMVYQEDVSRVAMAVAGFPAGQADGLRKVLTKKRHSRRLASCREKFFEGGRKRGIATGVLKILWDMILSFEGYSFCKPHSASYALVSMRASWLKRYYPLEFFTSVINNGGGFYDRHVYVNEVKRLGFTVLPPDVNTSTAEYRCAGGILHVGLSQIAGLSVQTIDTIVEKRKSKGPYIDVTDFLDRVKTGYSQIRLLIRAGAMDCLSGGCNRPQLLWTVYHYDGQRELFGHRRLPSCLKAYSRETRLAHERELLGFIVSRQVLQLFRPRIEHLIRKHGLPVCIDSRSLRANVGKTVCIAGTRVSHKEVFTNKRKVMCFVSFEDEYAVFETVLFPREWQSSAAVLLQAYALVACGTVCEEYGALTIEVSRLYSLSRQPAETTCLTK